VEIPNLTPNPTSIVDILTLRYDTTISPNLSKKSWKDFVSIKEIHTTKSIEDSICNELNNKLNLINEKEISIALSGGIDSTLVLCLLRKIKPNVKIHAISIKFANSVDETPAAAKIAEKFNAIHHIVQLENYLSELPKAISIIKLPFWDLHWYYVVKNSQKFSNVLISGDGGDELFGGYTFRYKKFLSLTTEDSTPIEKVKSYLECHERDRVPDQENIFLEKCNFSWNSIYEKLIPFFDNNLSRLEQVYLADYNGKLLYNFNPINTRIIDYFQMHLLTPILNNELVSTATKIQTESKYDEKNDIGKLQFRSILDSNDCSHLINKEKLGFNVNTINLWKSQGQKLCKEFLIDSRIVKDNWINDEWIKKYINNSDLDVRYVNKFFGLLAFEIWYRLFVTKEMDGETKL